MGNSKVFKLTATVPMGHVTFGILNKRVWVTCETQDRTESVCSLDAPAKAVALALRMLDRDLWPNFAWPLLPVPDHQEMLPTGNTIER